MNVSSSFHGDVTTGCKRSAVNPADKSFFRQMFHRPVCECCMGKKFSIVVLVFLELSVISRVWNPNFGAVLAVRIGVSCLQGPREYWNKAQK